MNNCIVTNNDYVFKYELIGSGIDNSTLGSKQYVMQAEVTMEPREVIYDHFMQSVCKCIVHVKYFIHKL